VGCGTQQYKKYFKHTEYTGMEYDSEAGRLLNADAYYDGQHFPFVDEEFDSILCTEVLEHVFNPDIFLKEVYRVLKPGGKAFFTTPLLWKEHQKPYDYGRYTSFGIRHIFEVNGFQILEQKKLVVGLRAIILLLNRHIKQNITTKNLYLRFFIYSFTTFPLNLVALSTPRNDSGDTYINNVVLVKKPHL
jgi:SAM-dependent methyltransferase